MKSLLILLFPILLFFPCACSKAQPKPDTEILYSVQIPTAGNSWVMDDNGFIASEIVTSEGIRNWSNARNTIRTFFYASKTGNISLGLKAKVSSGVSKIKVLYGNEQKEIAVQETEHKDIYIGEYKIDKVGYHFVDIVGVEKSGATYADVNHLLLGNIQENETKYIKDEFYWGRRGPSVHLNYGLPDGVTNVEWFYSQVMIPEDQDVVGSYFMANGFNEGYFGIQVNSPTERRILFSIWSPYKTDTPSEIPEEYKIKLLKKGENVTTGEFGNEGSGGQSYKVFSWKTGVEYGFLVGAKPTEDNNTDYSAYFHDPETDTWSLIAQFRRPKTNTYLKGLYAFLENFIPDQGVFERQGQYANQWVYDVSGWHEINEMRFTADNTARKQNRLDYSGGVVKAMFYLKHCGFSNDQTPIDTQFSREKLGVAPTIDFNSLD